MLNINLGAPLGLFTLCYDPSETVSRLKERIELIKGIKQEDQFLLYKCKPLYDEKSIDSYGIQDKETLELSLRLRGGTKTKYEGVSVKKTKKDKKDGNIKKNKYYFDDFQLLRNELLPKKHQDVEDVKRMYKKMKKRKTRVPLRAWRWEIDEDCARIVRLSSDNRYIACTGNDMSLMLFDLEGKSKVWQLKDIHDDPPSSLDLSKNDKYVITASLGGSIKVFDVKTAKELHKFLHVHKGGTNSAKISSDNKFIISTGVSDGLIKKFDLRKDIQIKSIENSYADGPQALALSDNNRYIITASQTKSLQVFDFELKSDPFNFPDIHTDLITSVVMSKDNKLIISASKDKSIKVFDLDARLEVYHFKDVHTDTITSLALSADSQYLISASLDKTIKVFNFETKTEVHHYNDCHKDRVCSVVVSLDNRYVVSGSPDKSINIFNLEVKPEVHQFTNNTNDVISSLVVSDNNDIISSTVNGAIKIHDIETKQTKNYLELGETGYHCLTLSKDKKYLAVGCSSENSLRVFDVRYSQKILDIKNAHAAEITSLAITDDSKYVISGSADKSIQVFDIQTEEVGLWIPDAHSECITSIAVSKNSEYLVSASKDGSIKIFEFGLYDFENQNEIYYFKHAHSEAVLSIALSPDGRYIVSGSADKSVKIFDIETKAEVYHFKDIHTGQVNSVAITADSRHIASASSDKSIKVFNIQTKAELYHFTNAHSSGVISVRFSNDLRYIVSSSTDNIKVFWTPFSLIDDEFYFVSSNISVFTAFTDYDEKLLENLDNSHLLKSYQDVYIEPHYWTLLHLQALFRPFDLPKIAVYSDFKAPFLVDRYHKTPLHYLLAHDKINYNAANVMFQYIIEYLEAGVKKKPTDYEAVFESMSNIIPFIIVKLSPKLVKQYLKLCLIPTPGRYREPLPKFGEGSKKYAFSKYLAMQPDILEDIYEEGDRQIVFRTAMIYLDYHPYLDDMSKFVAHLVRSNDKELFRLPIMSVFVNYLWNMTYPYMFSLGLLYSVMMVLLSFHVAANEIIQEIAIPIFIICGILIFWELIKIYLLGRKYFRKMSNLVNFVHLASVIIFIALDVSKTQTVLSEDILAFIMLFVGYILWVSYLRLFAKTRNLIHIIIFIIADIMGFLFILCFMALGCFVVFLELNRNHGLMKFLLNNNRYEDIYNNIFSLTDGSGDAVKSNDKMLELWANIIMVGLFFLVNVVLVNLMISIMGDSYDQIQEKKALVDAVTRLEMMQEGMLLARVSRRKIPLTKGYLMFCGPQKEEDSSFDSGWDGKINVIKKLHQESENKMEHEINNFRREVFQVKREIIQMKQEVKQEMNKEGQQMKYGVNQVKSEVGDVRDELKEAVQRETESIRKEFGRIISQVNEEIYGFKEEMNMLKEEVLSKHLEMLEAISSINSS